MQEATVEPVELFSQREARRQNSGQTDVLIYDALPRVLRVQISYIWDEALGDWNPHGRCSGEDKSVCNVMWHVVDNIYTEEKGVASRDRERENPRDRCHAYLMETSTVDALDLIDLTFRMVDRYARNEIKPHVRKWEGLCTPDYAIKKLNHRFRQHNVGYEFDGGYLMRVDSRLLHAKAVRPALHLLQGAGPNFAGPLDEYLEAHADLRKGETKDAIAKALKSLESTLKAICTERSWSYDPNKATAKDLLDIVFTNGLVPEYTQGFFTPIRGVLEAGVPTARNRTAGHGQGPQPIAVPSHLAAFIMYQTAAGIVFLIEAHKALE
jgi:hypothetical protein